MPPSSEELAEALCPYYGFVLDTFGCDRCMFESNFPMDKVSCSYRTLWNMFKRVAAMKGLSAEQKRAAFYGTAARVYRLDVPAVEEIEAMAAADRNEQTSKL